MKKREYDVPNYNGSYIEIGTEVLRNKLCIKNDYQIQAEESLGFAMAYKYFSKNLSKRTRFTAGTYVIFIKRHLVTFTILQADTAGWIYPRPGTIFSLVLIFILRWHIMKMNICLNCL